MIIEIKGVRFFNKGAEMMLLAVIDRLKKEFPNAKLAMTTADPYEKRASLGLYQKISKYRFRLQLGNLGALIPKSVRDEYGLMLDSEVDAIIDVSGFIHGDQLQGWRSTLMARESVHWKKASKAVVLLPQSFGPFESEERKRAINTIVANSDIVYARDKFSYNHIQEATSKPERAKIFLSPDITILLEGRKPEYFDPKKYQIAIIPNDAMINHTSEAIAENYKKFIAYCIKKLREKNYKPFLLLHEQKFDAIFADIIKKETNKEIDMIIEDDARLIKGILANCHAVISSRFHALVSSLSQGIPTLGTGWSHKYQTLFESYGCIENLIDLNNFDTELIDKKLESILEPEKRAALATRLTTRAQIQKKEVEKMWDTVIAILKEKNRKISD